MSQRIINVGSGELTGDGESIREALIKTNDNFSELYQAGYIDVLVLKTLVASSIDFEDFKTKIENL